MASCDHRNLILLVESQDRKRCLHCHLTISADELGRGHCPECFEAYGIKRYDFEVMAPPENGKARYRCEACGIIIGDDNE